MAREGAAILGVGMMSAVGDCAAQTASSVRAGINRFEETSIHDRRFQPIVMALVPDECLPPLVPDVKDTPALTARQSRMLRLAAPALKEALGEGFPGVGQLPVLLGTPENSPGQRDPSGPDFLKLLSAQSGVPFDVGSSRTYPKGPAAVFHALKEALELLGAGKRSHVLVGAVDTYLDLYLLGTLDNEERILAEGVMDGFVPGEGAAFLLLGSPSARVGPGGRSLAGKILGSAVGVETGHRYSDEPYRGDGLAETLGGLFSGVGQDSRVMTVYAGLNGESYGAKEWGVSALRHRDGLVEDFELNHPADCFGNAGAALGSLMLGCAVAQLADGSIQDPCLVWSSSDLGDRGAALLGRF